MRARKYSYPILKSFLDKRDKEYQRQRKHISYWRHRTTTTENSKLD